MPACSRVVHARLKDLPKYPKPPDPDYVPSPYVPHSLWPSSPSCRREGDKSYSNTRRDYLSFFFVSFFILFRDNSDKFQDWLKWAKPIWKKVREHGGPKKVRVRDVESNSRTHESFRVRVCNVTFPPLVCSASFLSPLHPQSPPTSESQQQTN